MYFLLMLIQRHKGLKLSIVVGPIEHAKQTAPEA